LDLSQQAGDRDPLIAICAKVQGAPQMKHGAVKGVSCGKILCLFQSQLKLTGLKGNARGGQIGQNGGGQHTTDCRKSGHDAE
jgi:hypothetical protein